MVNGNDEIGVPGPRTPSVDAGGPGRVERPAVCPRREHRDDCARHQDEQQEQQGVDADRERGYQAPPKASQCGAGRRRWLSEYTTPPPQLPSTASAPYLTARARACHPAFGLHPLPGLRPPHAPHRTYRRDSGPRPGAWFLLGGLAPLPALARSIVPGPIQSKAIKGNQTTINPRRPRSFTIAPKPPEEAKTQENERQSDAVHSAPAAAPIRALRLAGGCRSTETALSDAGAA